MKNSFVLQNLFAGSTRVPLFVLLLWELGLLMMLMPNHNHFVVAAAAPPDYNAFYSGGGGCSDVTKYRYTSRAAVAFAAAPWPQDLWAIRIASASLTYFGFVAVADRPRGQLAASMNPPQSHNNGMPLLKVQPSEIPGAGLGLFVTQDLSKGTVLGDYPGVVIPLAQHTSKLRTAPECEEYIWRFGDNQFVIDPTDENGVLQEVCRGGNPNTPLSIQLFSTILSFVTVPTTLCRINEPPKGRDVNVITQEDLTARKVTFSLERDVYAGEELFIDYGLSYDRSRYGSASGGNDDTVFY